MHAFFKKTNVFTRQQYKIGQNGKQQQRLDGLPYPTMPIFMRASHDFERGWDQKVVARRDFLNIIGTSQAVCLQQP